MIVRNDVLFVELPPPLGGAGHEQRGRRPAIALQDELSTLSTILVLPLTSRLEALRFPFTLRLEPSAANGLRLPSVLLLTPLQKAKLHRKDAKIAKDLRGRKLVFLRVLGDFAVKKPNFTAKTQRSQRI